LKKGRSDGVYDSAESFDILDPLAFQVFHEPDPEKILPNDASQSKRAWTDKQLASLHKKIITMHDTTHKGRPMSIAVRLGVDAQYVRKVLNERNP
jgi:hypothetical protein